MEGEILATMLSIFAKQAMPVTTLLYRILSGPRWGLKECRTDVYMEGEILATMLSIFAK